APPPLLSLPSIPRPPSSTLFPYTTLFRSSNSSARSRRACWRQPTKVNPVSATKRRLNVRGGIPAHFAQSSRRRFVAETGFTFVRSEEHTSELQSLTNLVCRLLLAKTQ